MASSCASSLPTRRFAGRGHARLGLPSRGPVGVHPLASGACIRSATRHVGQDKCCLFQEPIDDYLADLHAQGNRIAGVLGVGPSFSTAVASGTTWRAADPALAKFSDEVIADVMADASTSVVRWCVGLDLFTDPPKWVFVEKVPVRELASWQDEKHSGGGRDCRLGAGAPPESAHSVVPSADAMAAFRPVDCSTIKHWPRQGPRAAIEFLRRATGLTPFTCHVFWQRQSGVHGDASIVWVHKVLTGYDRLDVSSAASVELPAQRSIVIERAVRISPKAPSLMGLHRTIEYSLEEGGGVTTKELTPHMAELAATEARIMKQSRFLREELDHRRLAERSGPKGGEKGGPK